MSVHRIASTYAKSLLDLSLERQNVDTIRTDMLGLTESMKSRDLVLMLKSPIISADRKQKVLDALFTGKIDPLSKSFIDIVLRKGREDLLPEIVKAFEVQYKAHKKITTVKLVTATPLTNDKLEAIKSKLLASNVTDESVEISTEVDPDIIGGFIIEVGDKLYDASVSHKLAKLRKEFVGNEYVKEF